MNIKSLRNSYEHLTMLERLSLADNAVFRDDENEINAVVAASPQKHFSQVDYLDLFDGINHFRLCNLIARLSYIMQFDFFLGCDFFNESERLSDNAKLVAFCYVRATDAWQAVCDEFGFQANFNQTICELLLSVEMLKRKDELLREFAFTESEARNYIKKQGGKAIIKTLADEVREIRVALKLPKR